MNRLAILPVLILFLLASCNSGKAQLVGKWQEEGVSTVTEFTGDGRIIAADGNETTYSIRQGRIVIMDKALEMVYDFEIKGDKLTLTPYSMGGLEPLEQEGMYTINFTRVE